MVPRSAEIDVARAFVVQVALVRGAEHHDVAGTVELDGARLARAHHDVAGPLRDDEDIVGVEIGGIHVPRRLAAYVQLARVSAEHDVSRSLEIDLEDIDVDPVDLDIAGAADVHL